MDKKTREAWLLAQLKNLDAVTGAGAARLALVNEQNGTGSYRQLSEILSGRR
jgi:hypothetical protein